MLGIPPSFVTLDGVTFVNLQFLYFIESNTHSFFDEWTLYKAISNLPPLIAADTAVICCIGVTDTPWPNAVVASSTSPTLSSLNIIPVASPFKSIPVFLPNPNFSI